MTSRPAPDDLARQAADLIQNLNRATSTAKAFTDPAQISATADAIANLLQRLPQTVQQLEAQLVDFHDNNAIRLATKPPEETSQQDIANEVYTAIHGLQRARELLGDAHTAIRRATGPLSNLGSPWPDEDDDEA